MKILGNASGPVSCRSWQESPNTHQIGCCIAGDGLATGLILIRAEGSSEKAVSMSSQSLVWGREASIQGANFLRRGEESCRHGHHSETVFPMYLHTMLSLASLHLLMPSSWSSSLDNSSVFLKTHLKGHWLSKTSIPSYFVSFRSQYMPPCFTSHKWK